MVAILDSQDTSVDRVHGYAVESPSDSGLLSEPEGGRDLPHLLSRFDPISLAQMDEAALLDRIDTKYVVGLGRLCSALAVLPDYYRILDIEGIRLNRYRTLYFDTEDFALYRHHHSGKRDRYKVRSREYLETGQSFLEIKWKGKRDRTIKRRARTPDFVTRWTPEAAARMDRKAQLEAGPLEPKVANDFSRVTLVSRHHRERVTLDLNLRFRGDGRSVLLPGIAVVEVKQDGLNRGSEFVRQMRTLGARPSGFSKYCLGVSMLYPEVKHNRFKPELRLIGRLMEGHGDA